MFNFDINKLGRGSKLQKTAQPPQQIDPAGLNPDDLDGIEEPVIEKPKPKPTKRKNKRSKPEENPQTQTQTQTLIILDEEMKSAMVFGLNRLLNLYKGAKYKKKTSPVSYFLPVWKKLMEELENDD